MTSKRSRRPVRFLKSLFSLEVRFWGLYLLSLGLILVGGLTLVTNVMTAFVSAGVPDSSTDSGILICLVGVILFLSVDFWRWHARPTDTVVHKKK